jgi:ComF family protein
VGDGMLLNDVTRALLDALFPPRCQQCGKTGAVLCVDCLATASAPEPPLCPRCGRSLAPGSREDAAACPTCASGRGPKALSALRIAAVYEGVVREGIVALKYRGQRRMAEPLGDLLAAELHAAMQQGARAELIVPVPLHMQRRRQRGFNQAELLARRCSSRLGIPVAAHLLLRRRATSPQVGLSLAERHSNIAGAFALASQQAHTRLAGRHLVLIDDVSTTGSTLDAAAEALRAAGPASILGIAVSRPTLGDDGVKTDAPSTTRSSTYRSSQERRQ